MAIALAAVLTLVPLSDEWIEVEGHDLIGNPPSVDEIETDLALSVNRGMGSGDVEEWRPLVAGHFPPEQVDNALCVIRSESGGNPSAKNPHSEARGLFQIMASVWAPHYGVSYADLYKPEINSYVAAQIWGDSGWKPWSPRTRRNCGL